MHIPAHFRTAMQQRISSASVEVTSELKMQLYRQPFPVCLFSSFPCQRTQPPLHPGPQLRDGSSRRKPYLAPHYAAATPDVRRWSIKWTRDVCWRSQINISSTTDWCAAARRNGTPLLVLPHSQAVTALTCPGTTWWKYHTWDSILVRGVWEKQTTRRHSVERTPRHSVVTNDQQVPWPWPWPKNNQLVSDPYII